MPAVALPCGKLSWVKDLQDLGTHLNLASPGIYVHAALALLFKSLMEGPFPALHSQQAPLQHKPLTSPLVGLILSVITRFIPLQV